MGEAIGQLLPFAAVVALSPFPIIAIVLILVTPRARTNGPAFLVGWFAGIGIVGAVLLVLATSVGASNDGEPAAWVDWLKLVLGFGLLGLAVLQWRSPPAADDEVAIPPAKGEVFELLSGLGDVKLDVTDPADDAFRRHRAQVHRYLRRRTGRVMNSPRT